MDGAAEVQRTAEDCALVARVAERDPAALRDLYARHAPTVYAICLRIVREPQDAEQVLVDVFAELWERPARFDAARGAPSTFLTLLARSRALDHVRGERRRDRHTAAHAADRSDGGGPRVATGADAGVLADERRRAVVDALDALDETHREAVRLSFYDGLTHSEIAERLGRPLGTVKTQVRQGLIRMRASLRAFWEGRKETP